MAEPRRTGDFIPLRLLDAPTAWEVVHPRGYRVRVRGEASAATLQCMVGVLNGGREARMIALSAQIRAFLYRRPTDMRKCFHGLVALTQSELQQDPLSGKRTSSSSIDDAIESRSCTGGNRVSAAGINNWRKVPTRFQNATTPQDQATLEVTRSQLSLILDGKI